jgi:hypothetical protein
VWRSGFCKSLFFAYLVPIGGNQAAMFVALSICVLLSPILWHGVEPP